MAAIKGAEGGSIQVGWTKAKVELLEPRSLRCFKCLAKGYVRETYPDTQDRSRKCYRCDVSGHVARSCTAPPKCPICTDLGRAAGHILESKRCSPQKKRGRKKRLGEQRTVPLFPAAETVELKPQRSRHKTNGDKIIILVSSDKEEAMQVERTTGTQ